MAAIHSLEDRERQHEREGLAPGDQLMGLHNQSATEVNVYREMVEADAKTWLLNPNSEYMRNFDILSTSALAFTAIVTPVEVCPPRS